MQLTSLFTALLLTTATVLVDPASARRSRSRTSSRTSSVTCPGVFFTGTNGTPSCCVGASTSSLASGATSMAAPMACATVINSNDVNYQAEVSSASRSLRASGTQLATTVSGVSLPVNTGGANAAAAMGFALEGLAGVMLGAAVLL